MRMNRVNRRSFIKRGGAAMAAAAAGPLILPARLLGADAPSKKINLLMIGCGRQGTFANLRTLLGFPEVRVVGACDVDRWRAENAQKMVNAHYNAQDCRLFTDHREALEMAGVDAVMNSTPDHWHAGVSLAAIGKGLHCCTEKPLTRYLAEGRALADAATARGIVFRTDTECRTDGYMHRIATLARNGYLGNITRIEVGVPKGDVPGGNPKPEPAPEELDYELWLGPAPKKDYVRDRVQPVRRLDRPGWMRCLDYCEGMITNWGTHLLDVAQLANNTERTGPVSVEGVGTYPEPGSGVWNVLTSFKVQFRYANGLILDYHTEQPYLRVEGDDGWVQGYWSAPGGLTASDPALLRIRPKETDLKIPQRSDKVDFIRNILNNTPGGVMIDAEIGHRANSMGQIAHIAIQRGRRLDWDPRTEQFTGDPEANRLLVGSYREGYALPSRE
jgi:myo-inositol 2-dehydrogenase / D-chiro-inositol 1-dehydrogenase